MMLALIFKIPNNISVSDINDYDCFLKVGTRWLNFVLAPSVLVPLPLLLLVVEQYKRADLDD